MDQAENRGLKRKRYEPPEEELSVRIGGKLHHETKEVHKASKRAKVFETQKAVKRLKDLRKKDAKDKAIGDLEAELTSLKDINHDAVGNSAFQTKVLKDHTLRDNDDVKNAVRKELGNNFLTPAEPGTTLAKIQSRLLSSKILATQVTASLISLKILLNPALKQRDKTVKSNIPAGTLDLVPHVEGRPSQILKAFEDLKPKNKTAKSQQLPAADDPERQSDSGVDEAGWESGSIDEDGDPGVDDGWESGSIEAGNHEDEESESDEARYSGEDSDSDNDELRVQPTKTKAPATKTAKGSSSKIESTFLPSLSVGFVRGSDDSDFSEAEDNAADMPKKNRRGQRARRAIWEKKFGRNANHKKKEVEENAAGQLRRNKGHTSVINTGSNATHSRNMSPTQGPVGSNRGLPKGKSIPQQQQPVDAGWGGRLDRASGGNSFKPSASISDKRDEKPLHPSWEAKRRLKEKEGMGIVPSQGTKIKF